MDLILERPVRVANVDVAGERRGLPRDTGGAGTRPNLIGPRVGKVPDIHKVITDRKAKAVVSPLVRRVPAVHPEQVELDMDIGAIRVDGVRLGGSR